MKIIRQSLLLIDLISKNVHRKQSSLVFNCSVNKFQAAHVSEKHLDDFMQKIPAASHEAAFEAALKNSLQQWNKDKASAWFYIPLKLSNLITVLAKHGFEYHNAENQVAVLNKWLLRDCESRIPRYATHQVGVGGLVYNHEKNEVLVIKDRHMTKSVWKLPGGASDLGENIEATAEREVFEETGIKSKFQSLIAFRQQHEYPGAFGRSDFYFVCRLRPETFSINACDREIERCEWKSLDELCEYTGNMVLNRCVNLIAYAKRNNNDFSLIDFNISKMRSILNNKEFSFFHREIDVNRRR